MRDIQNDAHILHVFREVDIATADALKAHITQTPLDCSQLILELSETEYIDSSVIRVLLHARKVFGDRFSVVAAGGSSLRRVLEITGIDRLMSIHLSLALALEGA